MKLLLSQCAFCSHNPVMHQFLLLFTRGDVPDVLVRASALRCFHVLVLELFPNFTEDANSVILIGRDFGGQMRGDKECPFNDVTN